MFIKVKIGTHCTWLWDGSCKGIAFSFSYNKRAHFKGQNCKILHPSSGWKIARTYECAIS